MTGHTDADQGRQRRRWWRIYVHKIQKKYATFVGIMVFVYGFLIVALALLGPYGQSDETLPGNLPMVERLQGAAEFLFLGETTWPAIICILIPAAVIFSLYLTHRLGGPLYRLEQSARELREGNLALRIRLREGDDLQELADALNAALSNIDQAFGEVRAREARQRQVLRQCLDTMKTQPSTGKELLKQMELALQEGEHVEAVFKRFQLSAPSNQP